MLSDELMDEWEEDSRDHLQTEQAHPTLEAVALHEIAAEPKPPTAGEVLEDHQGRPEWADRCTCGHKGYVPAHQADMLREAGLLKEEP